jgi:hypothetical protein
MNKTKYVIVKGKAIVFSELIIHSDMVGYNQKAEGAGFVQFTPYVNEWGEERVKATCYGESVSLNVKSREEEDSLIITRQICRL